jgi:hypothetical protein
MVVQEVDFLKIGGRRFSLLYSRVTRQDTLDNGLGARTFFFRRTHLTTPESILPIITHLQAAGHNFP